MPEQDELFKRRMIDLARQAESRSMYTFSGFLGLAEQDMYTRMGKDLGFIDHELYGGSPAAERQLFSARKRNSAIRRSIPSL